MSRGSQVCGAKLALPSGAGLAQAQSLPAWLQLSVPRRSCWLHKPSTTEFLQLEEKTLLGAVTPLAHCSPGPPSVRSRQTWGGLWVLSWLLCLSHAGSQNLLSEAQEDRRARSALTGASPPPGARTASTDPVHGLGQAQVKCSSCCLSSGLPISTEILPLWKHLARAPREWWREAGRTPPDCTVPRPLPQFPAVLYSLGRPGGCFLLLRPPSVVTGLGVCARDGAS